MNADYLAIGDKCFKVEVQFPGHERSYMSSGTHEYIVRADSIQEAAAIAQALIPEGAMVVLVGLNSLRIIA